MSRASCDDEYWRLPIAERQHREAALEAIPREYARRPSSRRVPLYEAHQPPLYYWLVAPILWIAADAALPTRVILLRWCSVLIASTAIPLTSGSLAMC